MKTHKEACMYHVVMKFGERFSEKDFTTKSKKWGEVVWKEEVVAAIANAPKMGKFVNGGKGDCTIFKVKVMETKPVFVVWNAVLKCAVTVLTHEMWYKTYGKGYQ